MNAASIKVLIVDDEDAVRETLADFLGDEGFQVSDVSNAEKGLTLIATQEVHVAVVDIRLPGMNGVNFIRHAQELQPKTRYLIFTGSVDFSVPETLAHLGFQDKCLFSKPLPDMSMMVRAILGLMEEG